MEGATQIEVSGIKLRLTHLDKVLYPEVGFTKAQVLEYYVRVAPYLLPHLAGRPLTLKRYPDGVEGGHFYEKRCPDHRPAWVPTVAVQSQRRGTVRHCVVGDLQTLVWAVNLADLEMHPSLSSGEAAERPTVVAFDLDPGEGAGIVQCCEVASTLRGLLSQLGLVAFPKTSGSKGLQVYVPLNTREASYARSKPFSRSVAEALEQHAPERVTSVMTKRLRPGKVLVDWSQNDAHKTTVAAYSLRAKSRPTVSTPLRWSEVEACAGRADPSLLDFDAAAVLRRVEEHGDLFAEVLTLQQRLPAAAKRPAGRARPTR